MMKGEQGVATIQPKGETIRQAVKWISNIRKDNNDKSLRLLIQQAAKQFNLSPREEEFLRSFYEKALVE
jgi:hypothetical protein